jgi:hypothetical protein
MTLRFCCAVLFMLLAPAARLPGAGGQAFSQSAPNADGINLAGKIVFDIGAQPVATALEQLGEATGFKMIYETAVVEGRFSPGVSGPYTPQDALRLILRETGLAAIVTGSDTFSIVPGEGMGQVLSYYGMVQTALLAELCRNPAIKPGGYRRAFQVNFDSQGRLAVAKFLGTAENPERDRLIAGAVATVNLPPPPPALHKTTLTILLEPKNPLLPQECEP